MEKVYIVLGGCTTDQQIIAACKTPEQAEDRVTKENKECLGLGAYFEEWAVENAPELPEQSDLICQSQTELEKKAVEIAKGYEKLPLQDRIDVIARTFGCATGKIETSPCRDKWRGTSDISIRFDNGASLPIGNYRTPKAKTVKVQSECVNAVLVRYNPEIVQTTKEAAIPVLLRKEAKDNAIAAQRGLKPYTFLNVELHDGADNMSGYMGWYYVTLAVDGKICTHLETGLAHDIASGTVSDTPTRENYFTAGALKEDQVDYVMNNVGFSSISDLYSLPLHDDVRARAEKTLAKRRQMISLEEAFKLCHVHDDEVVYIADSVENAQTWAESMRGKQVRENYDMRHTMVDSILPHFDYGEYDGTAFVIRVAQCRT